MTTRPVLLLEFNELSPTLIEQFMGEGHLPNFKRLFLESQAYVTDAQEEQEALEPWIQWVTVHTGLSYDEHGVFVLGDGPKCTKPRLWDILSQHGFTNWVCGSMNLRYETGFKGFVVPDPWTVGAQPFPADEFTPYLDFVRANVQEHTNREARLPRSAYVAFLRYMLTHGLSSGTIGYLARQLFTERVTGKYHWRRAVALDRMQWDVFRWYFKREHPDFSTFFLNSTAHFQHLHWRNMDPDVFQVKPSDAEQAEYEDAILYGYQQMDHIIGNALTLAGDTHTIVFASALGQQPCLKYEEQGGKVFYRPKDFKAFTAWAGLRMPHEIQPVMSEEFHLVFENERDARAAEQQLAAITIDGRPAMRAHRDGNDILAGCGVFDRLDGDPVLRAPGAADQTFLELFYLADGLKSGMHHPDGILWIRGAGRGHRVHQARIPLRSVAPTILSMFGIDASDQMSGRPLVDTSAAAT